MPKPYARAAAAAEHEGKGAGTYIDEQIRMQLREAERTHELVPALDEIAIKLENDTSESERD